MDVHDLEEYLKMVVDLEENVYLQGQLMKDLQLKIPLLGQRRRYEEPVPPEMPQLYSWLRYPFALVGALIGSVIAIFISGIFFGLVTMILPFLEVVLAWVWIILSVLFFLGLASAMIWTIWSHNSKATKEYLKAMKDYHSACERYQAALVQEENRLIAEAHRKKLLQKNLQQLEDQNRATVQTLSNIYSLNIIYEKYRSFSQVCTVYEYICSGRCTTLGERFGNDGAYNLLEQEERQAKIILKLDQILQSLNQIKATQYMLYHAIQEGNQKMNMILSGIDRISSQIDQAASSKEAPHRLEELEKSSAIAAYHAERIEKELSYMNRMNYYSGKYDNAGMFRQRPPV